ncbi:hypothetical protein ACFY2K_36905 [Kitasatospora sp. NPDC001309]|uniref:hypothetical protein n=1 Tax=unclassified Kitasatospora TaxID=2633591 RepID=UPI0036BC0C82
MSLLDDADRVESLSGLSCFRADFYDCLTARADALFELTNALQCSDRAVKSLVDLALTVEHRREDRQMRPRHCRTPRSKRLKNKLRGLASLRRPQGKVIDRRGIDPHVG